MGRFVIPFLVFANSWKIIEALDPQSLYSTTEGTVSISIRLAVKVISWAVALIAGVIVGWRVRERGWFYGAVAEIVLSIILLGPLVIFYILTFFIPASEMFGLLLPNDNAESRIVLLEFISNTLRTEIIFILLASAGGQIGEKLHNRKSVSS